VIVGAATVGKLTVKLNVVVLVTPPPVAVTVTVEFPAGVEALVLMVRVEAQAGLHEADEKEVVAPEGRPETENETAWLLPEVKDALIELVTEEPAVTELFPELDSEKAKGCVIVKEALASLLELYPLLNAFAFTTALFVRVIAPL
jgi:hypothetical protein